MKILTVLGTRPEIIRLSRVIPKLDDLCDHLVVHTGQNFDPNLCDLFFQEMEIRPPNYYLGVKGSTIGEVIGQILIDCEKVLRAERPDRLLILGDTNSSLVSIIAKRMGIPVYHMEAGNRCYDDNVPEEVNRRIIDHSSDLLMPYTERSRQNLLMEGIPGERICITGNPIYEVMRYYEPQIARSNILPKLEVDPKSYLLVTAHRAENVNLEERLRGLTFALDGLQREYEVPVIVSTHPHTKACMEAFGIGSKNNHIRFLPPFGFFDFITLEKNALCVVSDSGTVQEECCILKIPNVTIRDVTERPETVECGSNIVSGADPEAVLKCVRTTLSQGCNWTVPLDYQIPYVSSTVVKIMMGFRRKDALNRL
jgi:UDP-N-acetylglucosamine 2-epimerase (non-hydrolysing)